MNRVASRSTIALLLILVLLGGMLFFAVEYVENAAQWSVYRGNPHVYNGNNIDRGTVLDRDGVLILDTNDGRVYSEDEEVRLSTVHWVGDREGYVSAPALSQYSEFMTGYNLINGLYVYGGIAGEAKMTISTQVQRTALKALGDNKGTVAVYNYKTGEILCAVSTPAFDPDNVPDIEADTTGRYDGMYLNRFTQSTYVPGSIFKVITAAAALELDEGCRDLEFTCEGKYRIYNSDVSCLGKHGTIDLQTALAESCNSYFAQLTQYIGENAMKSTVERLQVVESLSFDGIATARGNYGVNSGDELELAWSGIGQHTDLVNPCRFMTVMGAIAGGGEAALPYVVSQVSFDGEVTYRALTHSTGELLSAETAQTLQELMRNNILTRYGEENFPDMTVCAKSGTAELGGGEEPHASFAGFVMDEEYPLAFVVFVENGGSGAKTCVPIIAKVLRSCKAVMDGV